ncbi:hypothetical protein M9Y10_023271 [Tritrichomonas musculus]|uniref:HTH myb-type domain-containing protein n=1 Tax=Tritrichomonas musculus TaxID=1915356 RepID=A0ABR2KUN0_9EUKA
MGKRKLTQKEKSKLAMEFARLGNRWTEIGRITVFPNQPSDLLLKRIKQVDLKLKWDVQKQSQTRLKQQ